MMGKQNQPASSSPLKEDNSIEEHFVWPWVGLVANIPTEVGPNRQPHGKSRVALREELIQRGFKPTKVELIWDYNGHSGFASVEFGKNVDGFANAMEFERKFALHGHGKRDWLKGTSRDTDLYGWVAREEDFSVSGVVGKKLRTKAGLKTLKQISVEEERKLNQLIATLPQSIDRESYYEEAIQKIRSDEKMYQTILKGDDLEKTENTLEMVDSSGEDFSDSEDEDIPKTKKIRR